MIVLGIDIGLTGALAAIGRNTVAVADLPVADERLAGRELVRLMRAHVPAGETPLVVFEDVRPRPMGNANTHGNTMHSQGSLMRSRGIVECACDIVGARVEVIQPATWKREFGLLAKRGEKVDKDLARRFALGLWPLLEPDLRRKKDHNRADALLIARYGQMRWA
jgi:hypothetical protein